MTIALPIWDGRVSPVFDVARELLLAEADGGEVRSRQRVALSERDPVARARRVVSLGVRVLICGAISQTIRRALEADDVRVIAQRCGDVEAVLQAFLRGGLDDDAFAMPGCSPRSEPLQDAAHAGVSIADAQVEVTCCDQVTVRLEPASEAAAAVERRWVAVVDARIVGTLTFRHADGHGHIVAFDIDSEWSHSPAPCRLLQAALGYCREQGLLKVTVEASIRSPRALELFRCLGFQPNPRQDNGHTRPAEFYINLYRAVDEVGCIDEGRQAPPSRQAKPEP